MEEKTTASLMNKSDSFEQDSKTEENSTNNDDNVKITTQEPLILEIMIEKEQEIKSTISLLKKEIAVAETSNDSNFNYDDHKKNQIIPNKKEFDGFTNFLTDDKINNIIKTIAGEKTKKLIDNTIQDISSKQSVDEKHKALANGIRKLQTNLRDANSIDKKNDPKLNLALSLLGLKKERLL